MGGHLPEPYSKFTSNLLFITTFSKSVLPKSSLSS